MLKDDDEFIILACDGVWESLKTNEFAVKYVADRINEKSLKKIGIEMINDVTSPNPKMTRGVGCDNMTVIIIDLQPKRNRAPKKRNQISRIFKSSHAADAMLLNKPLQKVRKVFSKNKPQQ